MMRHLALLLSLAVCLVGCSQKRADQEEKAISAIRELGGRVTRHQELPGRPFDEVDLTSSKITDAGLKELKGLKNLQWLDLTYTQITDAGLKDLKELKALDSLVLHATQITDAGL